MIAGDRVPVARYRLQLRALEPLHLPSYAGFLLRSVLGNALRRMVCTTGMPKCEPCPLLRSCAYPRLFDPPAVEEQFRDLVRGGGTPCPFVLEPPPLGTQTVARGEPLSIGLVLFGQARQELPQFVLALRQAFSAAGVGHEGRRGHAELTDVLCEEGAREVSVYEHRELRPLGWVSDLVVPDFPRLRSARLTLLTPLCLTQDGKILRPAQLRARAFVIRLMTRARALFALYAGRRDRVPDFSDLLRKAEALEEQRAVQACRTRWYSARQDREIWPEGTIGEWTLRGDLTELAPWLWLGQWLHVGKKTSMGLGRYQVELSD